MLLKSKHSLGPWKVADAFHPIFVVDGKGYDVCRMALIEPLEENGANARLIAAAPDMYDSLLHLQPMLYGMLLSKYGDEDKWPNDRQDVVLYRRAYAALRKARGDTTD